MAETKYLTLAGLTSYNTELKKYIKTTAVKNADGVKVTQYVNKTNADDVITAAAYAALDPSMQAGYEAKAYETVGQSLARIDTALETAGAVTLAKADAADTGYAATYVLSQNGEEKGKINIPKDFLVKSGSVKVYAATDTEVAAALTGIAVGDKYLDFVVNAVDDSATAQHMYILVKDLVDIYTGGTATDNVITVTVSDANVITATIADASIARAKINATFESDIAAIETALGAKTEGAYVTVADAVKNGAENATFTPAGDGATATTIQAAIRALQADMGNIAVIEDSDIEGLFA